MGKRGIANLTMPAMDSFEQKKWKEKGGRDKYSVPKQESKTFENF